MRCAVLRKRFGFFEAEPFDPSARPLFPICEPSADRGVESYCYEPPADRQKSCGCEFLPICPKQVLTGTELFKNNLMKGGR